MSDWYESMSRTPIRDALNGFRVRQRPPFVIPAKAGIHALTSRERSPTAIPPPTPTERRRHSAHPRRTPLQTQFARRPKEARAEPTQTPLFVFQAKAGIQGGGVAPMTPKDLQRLGVIFIPWCAGPCRHERLVRKRRLGGSRGKKCRAGACPQPWVAGLSRGRAGPEYENVLPSCLSGESRSPGVGESRSAGGCSQPRIRSASAGRSSFSYAAFARPWRIPR